MLELSNINAGYGELKVLQDLNMHIDTGSFNAIIGPNGAGKSTVLKTIFSLCKMRNGRVIYDEEDISDLKTHELIERKICYVPQGRPIFSDLTIEENLLMGAYTIQDKKLIEQRKKNIYQSFSKLQQRKKQLAYTLSGGERQTLAIARAMMHEPKLLLLDEPSLGLSPKAMKDIFAIIKDINKQGTTIIMVEQNAKAAVKLADKTFVLEEGSVKLEGGPELLEDDRIGKIYFGGA